MLPTYVSTIALVVSAIGLFTTKIKNPYTTVFDIGMVYLIVAVLAVVILFFYDGVIADTHIANAVDSMSKILELDPSGKIKHILRCQNDVTASDFKDKVKSIDMDNIKHIRTSGPGLFIYTSSILAVVSIILHVIKNIKDGKTAFRPVEGVILICGVLIGVIPILMFYGVVQRSPLIQKSDMAVSSLADLKSVISRELIELWNSDDSLRTSMDDQQDAGVLGDQYKADLADIVQQVNLLVPALDVLSDDMKTKLTDLFGSVSKTAQSVIDDLSAAAKDPCASGNFVAKAAGAAGRSVLPHLVSYATAVHTLSTSGTDSGRSDVDVLIQNFADSSQEIIQNLQRFEVMDHCNRRERVRMSLSKLQGSCELPETDQVSFFKRVAHNVNGLLLMICGAAILLIYVNKTSTSKLFWQPTSVMVTVSLMILFMYIMIDFLKSGKYKTIIDIDEPKYFYFMLLSGTKSPHARLHDMSAKPNDC